MNPIDQLFDEENRENIVMYSETGEKVEFEQIAIVPLNGEVFVILRPVEQMEGIAADEALVFAVSEFDGEECLMIVEDDATIDEVFAVYYKLLDEAEGQ